MLLIFSAYPETFKVPALPKFSDIELLFYPFNEKGSLLIVLSCLALMVPWLITTADTWHRVRAANFDVQTVKNGIYGKYYSNYVALAFLWGVPIVIGIFAGMAHPESPFESFLLSSFQELSVISEILFGVVAGIVLAGLIGATLSSVDTLLIGASFLVCNDYIKGFSSWEGMRQDYMAKYVLIILGFVSTILPIVTIVYEVNLFHIIQAVASSVILLFPLFVMLSVNRLASSITTSLSNFTFYAVILSFCTLIASIIYGLSIAANKPELSYIVLSSVPIISLFSSILFVAIALIITMASNRSAK